MKIAFVESRDKTTLFDAIAAQMGGHEIEWLVQNRAFARVLNGRVTVLDYPTRRQCVAAHGSVAPDTQEIFDRVAASDRTALYFGRDTDHYGWYYLRICEWFDSTRPEVIFGEAGSFHSHLVALEAERRGIRFLNPMSSRYPTGRFAFFQSDQLTPFGGSNEQLTHGARTTLAEDIVAGRLRPDYMTATRTRVTAMRARGALLREWAKGERFTAQSPLLFARNKRLLAGSRERWDAHATHPQAIVAAGGSVLYPLQLQPEMNLDVWGVEYRDQTQLMVTLADKLAADGRTLWVKPNPKSFYEMSPELVDAAISHPNVNLLSHDVRMPEVASKVDLVVTVSGSVAIERLLARQPVAVLLQPYAEWIGAPSPAHFDITPSTVDETRLQQLKDAQDAVDPAEVVGRLVDTSYRGVISEPSYMPGVLERENVTAVATAFEDVIGSVRAESRERQS